MGEMFSQIEDNKQRLGIREYAIGQTTLEQIFIGISNKDKQEAEELTPSAVAVKVEGESNASVVVSVPAAMTGKLPPISK